MQQSMLGIRLLPSRTPLKIIGDLPYRVAEARRVWLDALVGAHALTIGRRSLDDGQWAAENVKQPVRQRKKF